VTPPSTGYARGLAARGAKQATGKSAGVAGNGAGPGLPPSTDHRNTNPVEHEPRGTPIAVEHEPVEHEPPWNMNSGGT
jgi:hypothetical protein